MNDLRFLDPNGLVNRESFNERFGLLNNLMNHIGNEYVWEKRDTANQLVGYVNSSDPNAYPPAVDDGFAYNRLGQLGGFAKIATGSYVGTGTYGSSNPTKINLPFDPKFILIASEKAKFYSGNSFMDWAFWFPGMTHLDVDGSSYCNTSIVDEQFRCYNDDLASYQFNKSNWIYHYLIVG